MNKRRRILLATMPRTGTRFFLSAIKQGVGREIPWIVSETQNLWGHTLGYVGHISYRSTGIIDVMRRFIREANPILLVTYREPCSHYESFKLAGSKLSRKQFLTTRALYDHFIYAHEPDLVLDFSAKDRDEQITKLSLLLGSKIEVDWDEKVR